MSRPSGSSVSGSARWRVWIAAVLFHVPGLRWLTSVPVTRRLVVPNVIAVGVTLLLAAAVGLQLGLWAGLALVPVGHVVWGVILAALVTRGDGRGALHGVEQGSTD